MVLRVGPHLRALSFESDQVSGSGAKGPHERRALYHLSEPAGPNRLTVHALAKHDHTRRTPRCTPITSSSQKPLCSISKRLDFRIFFDTHHRIHTPARVCS